ncbi:hypothetical protein BB561_005843 [Smittium simulii]|uniref:Uncharacterized protein n=1 Tax=Smittium simulii TaxID=133385 RepID=A0A2T9Y817_9FUNG|nr:hypothetical protein BB561_005843 [Smittium simulii]
MSLKFRALPFQHLLITHTFTKILKPISTWVSRNWIQNQQKEVNNDSITIILKLMILTVSPNKIQDLRQEATRLLNIRRHMGILHQNKHQLTGVIYSNIYESSRCTVKTNCTYRKITTAVKRHASNRNKRTPALLIEMETTNIIEYNNSSLDFDNMVSNTGQASKIRDKQDMTFNNVENQRSILQKKDLSDIAINLTTSNARIVKRRFRNYTIQKGFICWRSDNNRYNKITAPDIINYLSKILLERNLKNLSIKAHTKHYNKPLSVDSITRHVKNLSELIKRPPNTPIPKTRAIGATLAATSGVPVENIVSHAFWSNYSMFDTYYRLDRSTQSNMTEAVLPLK